MIISNNPLSFTQHNGKTIGSFVKNWDKNSISQLFFKDEIPASENCRNFYKITDTDVLKLFFGKIKSAGTVINAGEPGYKEVRLESKKLLDNLIEKFKLNDSSKLLREFLWSKSRWCQKSLLKWLDEFKPEVIFFCGGDSIFAYSITHFIAHRFKAKIIFYVTDDYITKRISISPAYWIRFIRLKKEFSEMVKSCKEFITIGKKMSIEYEQRFGKKSIVAMNSVEIPPYNSKISSGTIKMVYMGGLHFNRWRTLSSLGKALIEINKSGSIAILEIYTTSKITDEIDKALNLGISCRIMGSLDRNGVREQLKESDILVHVEAFNKKSIHSTRLSVSTKIPEYMAASRCILGIGPVQVASIEYLSEFAYVITDARINIIYDKLKDLVHNEKLMGDFALKAHQLALKNHNIEDIAGIIYNASLN